MRNKIAILMLLTALWVPAQTPAAKPETILVTLHARPGAEAELEKVIERHWSTARRLKLIEAEPHLTLRGIEAGSKTYFVHVFTWKNAAIPDAAPKEIQAIWADMNRLVEARDGKQGLTFEEVFPTR